MAITNCSDCIFSSSVSLNTDACKFNIPKLITGIKKINIINDFYQIEDYRCQYGFGKKQFSNNKEALEKLDIENAILSQAKLKYYLVVDLRFISYKEVETLLETISNLDILPTYISFIIGYDYQNEIYLLIKNFTRFKKWKIHVFIDSLDFSECIKIVLDTNLTQAEAWCVSFLKPEIKNLSIELNSYINNLHDIFILEQLTATGVCFNKNDINLMTINSGLYKSLTSQVDKNIVSALQQTPEIQLLQYDKK